HSSRSWHHAVPGAHVRRDCRLPPLLLAPVLQDQPGRPVPARFRGAEYCPEGRALVGGEASPPSQALRHSGRRVRSKASRILLRALRVNLPEAVSVYVPLARGGSRRLSRVALAEHALERTHRAARHCLLPDRWLAGSHHRLFLEY